MDLSRLAQQQNMLEYQQSQQVKRKLPETVRIGEYDPNTGRDRVIFPNGGEVISGVRTFNSSVPYGTPVRATRANGSQVVALDSRQYIPYEEEKQIKQQNSGFVLFMCLDQTGSVGINAALKGIEIINNFIDGTGNKKILGLGFVSFGDSICQVFSIDNVQKAKTALQKAVDLGGYPFFCDSGGDTPENGVDALKIGIDELGSSILSRRAKKKYLTLITDTWGFAHNSNAPLLVRKALNSGKITKTFLDFGLSLGGTGYAVTFPQTKFISHSQFNI